MCAGWDQIRVLMDPHFVYMGRSWAESSAFLRAGRNGDMMGKTCPFLSLQGESQAAHQSCQRGFGDTLMSLERR